MVDERELEREKEEDPSSLNHAAGWFLGIEAGVCYFGLSDSALRDEEVLIGTLGHEVAHAYRDHHGLIVSARDTEEQLTDLTTIYLGFGSSRSRAAFGSRPATTTSRASSYSTNGRRSAISRPGSSRSCSAHNWRCVIRGSCRAYSSCSLRTTPRRSGARTRIFAPTVAP